MSALRPILLLGLLVALPAPAWAVRQGDACEGELWRKIGALLKPETRLPDAVEFLDARAIRYRLVDMKLVSDTNREEAYAKQGIQAGFTIVLSESRPENKPTFASLPVIVRADELTVINFDADDALIDYYCEIILTGP